MRRSGELSRKPVMVFVCAALLSLLSGCARERAGSQHIYVETKSLAHAQEVALKSQVSCVGSGQCHEAVALLAVATEDNTYGCNGFLVAPDLMITNSHCVPKELQASGSNCSNRMWAFFPKVDMTPATVVGCSAVQNVLLSRFGNDPDYALIKLDRPVDRRSLKISRDGATANNPTLFRVRTIKENNVLIGELGRGTCEVALNTIPTPFADSIQSPVLSLGTCELKPGDSGSPLLNSQGEVWGLVQSFFPKDWEIVAPLNEQRFPALNKRIGLATNLACINTPFADARPLPEACDVDFSEFQDPQENWNYLKARGDQTYASDVANAAVTRAMNEHLMFAPLPVGRWKATEDLTADRTTTALPQCITRSLPIAPVYYFTMPAMRITSGINAYFQHDFRAAPTERIYNAKLEIDFPIATLSLSQGGTTVVSIDSLEFCPEAQ